MFKTFGKKKCFNTEARKISWTSEKGVDGTVLTLVTGGDQELNP
jgi:hypothetical protein